MGIVETNAQFLACEQWLFKVDFNYGWFDKIKQQKVTGVDLVTGQLINASSKVEGSVYDISGALGYQFNLDRFCLSLAPLVGWSYYHQHYKNHHYFDHCIHEEFRVQNQYKFSWNGPWVGFATAYQVCPEWQFYLDYAFHWAEFKAKFFDVFIAACPANSKTQRGYGNEVTVGTTYQFCENWFLGFKFDYKDFWANKCHTSLRYENGDGHERATQKNIEWSSYYATVDAGYLF